MNQRPYSNNLFLVEPYEGQYLLYAPLKGVVLSINKDAVSVLDYLYQNPDANYSTNSNVQNFIELLNNNGLSTQDIFEDKLPSKPVFDFKPTHVTLLPTFDCNLRCVYCYAESGDISNTRMEWDIAKASIDLIVNNALEIGSKTIRVSFHGGGEPTLNWSLLTRATSYAQELTRKNNLKLLTHLTTNGVFSEHQRIWLGENMSRIQISIDGTSDIHNAQRPMANGQGSFEHVVKTIKFLEEKQLDYQIQTVITKDSVNRMTELVDFFASITSGRSLHFEPVFECGRCSYSGWKEPEPEIFADEFIKAWKHAASLSINLICSLSRPDIRTSSFCGATSKNFFVTPDGNVTACLEVSRLDDNRAETFIYGHYDSEQNKFVVNEDKLKFLASRNIYNMPTCADCAVKWHCAGDCLAKAFFSGDMFTPAHTSRCDMTQLITSRQLLAFLQEPEIGKIMKVRIENIEC